MANFEKQLISAIKQYPFLYDSVHRKYNDRSKRLAAWTNISNNLNVSVERLKLRWRTLRNSYRVELLKQADNKRVKWRHYELMKFLSDTSKYKKFNDVIDNTEKTAKPNNAKDNTKKTSKLNNVMDNTEEKAKPNNAKDNTKETAKLNNVMDNTEEKAKPNHDACGQEENDVKVTDDQTVELVMPEIETIPLTIKCEPGLTEESFKSFSNFSYTNYGSELTTFMEAMTAKIGGESLNRDQMDELQEQMLILLNQKLREYRKINKIVQYSN